MKRTALLLSAFVAAAVVVATRPTNRSDRDRVEELAAVLRDTPPGPATVAAARLYEEWRLLHARHPEWDGK